MTGGRKKKWEMCE